MSFERSIIRQKMKVLEEDNARMSAALEELRSLNAKIMQQALMTSSVMVWIHGKKPLLALKRDSRVLVIPKAEIEEAYLLKIAAETLKNGDRKFTVKKMTQEEVEQVRRERLAKLHGTGDSGPKIITP